MKHDTAGDPMTGVKWTRRTTDKIACELKRLGVNVSSKTVGRLLKQLGFSLRVNHEKLCGATSEDRDTQFACIAELRERFGVEYDSYFQEQDRKLRETIEPEFYVRTDDELLVTPAGRLFVRNLCMIFDRYLTDSKGGTPLYSRTV